MLNSPSSYQVGKLGRHGWTVVDSGHYLPAAAWSGIGAAGVSHFVQSADLPTFVSWAACSGHLVLPAPGGAHGSKVSIVLYLGMTTGAGIFGGAPRAWEGVRLVNVDQPTRVHLIPDEVRLPGDLELHCRRCGHVHQVATLAQSCSCGARLRR